MRMAAIGLVTNSDETALVAVAPFFGCGSDLKVLCGLEWCRDDDRFQGFAGVVALGFEASY